MAVGVSVLSKVNVADWPAANASVELPCQEMEVLPSRAVSVQPSTLPGLLMAADRLLPDCVQAYQKPSSEVLGLVFFKTMV